MNKFTNRFALCLLSLLACKDAVAQGFWQFSRSPSDTEEFYQVMSDNGLGIKVYGDGTYILALFNISQNSESLIKRLKEQYSPMVIFQTDLDYKYMTYVQYEEDFDILSTASAISYQPA